MFFWTSYKCSISYFHTPITIFERWKNIFISPRLRNLRTLTAISCFIFCFAFFFQHCTNFRIWLRREEIIFKRRWKIVATNDDTSIANNKKDFIMYIEKNKKRWKNINNKKKSFYFFTTFLFYFFIFYFLFFIF